MINLFLEERSLMVERSVGAQLPMLMFSCLQLLLLQWFFPFTVSREGWLALLRGIALIACVSASVVCQLSFRMELPKAVHAPGVASLPGPPIPRLPAPSVFACVLLGIGVPWCLPHLREDAVWGGSMTAVCLHSASAASVLSHAMLLTVSDSSSCILAS